MVLGVCCIGVILIIFLGGMLFPESSKTFTGPSMSFNYPSSWNVYSTSATTVTLNNEGKEVYVEIMGTSIQAETNQIVSEGYYYDDKSISGTTYREFNQKKDISVTVLLFEKNGKVFEITGDPLDTGGM